MPNFALQPIATPTYLLVKGGQKKLRMFGFLKGIENLYLDLKSPLTIVNPMGIFDYKGEFSIYCR